MSPGPFSWQAVACRQGEPVSMKSRQTMIAGPLSVVAAAVLWGTTGTAQTFAPPGFDPLVVGTLRLGIGALALCAVALRHCEMGPWRSWPWPATILAAAFIAAFQLCFFRAVAMTGVAVGTIVGLGSGPIWTGVFSSLLFAERPGRRWQLATGLAVCGCVLLVLASTHGAVRVDPFGMLLATAAGASYAAYALALKRVLAVKAPCAAMTAITVLGTVLLLPLVWDRDFGWVLHWRGLAVALYLGLFSMALAMVLFARGLRHVPTPTAVTLTLAEPMTAGLLGVLVVGERLPPAGWCGLLLVLAGLVLLSVRRPRGLRTEN